MILKLPDYSFAATLDAEGVEARPDDARVLVARLASLTYGMQQGASIPSSAHELVHDEDYLRAMAPMIAHEASRWTGWPAVEDWQVALLFDLEAWSLAARLTLLSRTDAGQAFADAMNAVVAVWQAFVPDASALVLHSRLVELAWEAGRGEWAPWKRLWAATSAALPVLDSGMQDRVIDAWLDGRLSNAHEAELRRRVALEGTITEAYRRRLKLHIREVRAYLPSVTVSLRFAPEDVDVFVAEQSDPDAVDFDRIYVLPLPHRGRGSSLRVRQIPSGVAVFDDGARPPDDPSVRLLQGPGEMNVSLAPTPDPILDDLALPLVLLPDSATDERTRACGRLSRWMDRTEDRARLAILSQALAKDFIEGALQSWLDGAPRIEEEAQREAAGDRAALALRARLLLDRASGTLEDPKLINLLIRADQVNARSSAVDLIPDDEYASQIEGELIDPDTWWGSRERLRQQYPDSLLDRLFEANRITAPGPAKETALAPWQFSVQLIGRRQLRASASSIFVWAGEDPLWDAPIVPSDQTLEVRIGEIFADTFNPRDGEAAAESYLGVRIAVREPGVDSPVDLQQVKYLVDDQPIPEERLRAKPHLHDSSAVRWNAIEVESRGTLHVRIPGVEPDLVVSFERSGRATPARAEPRADPHEFSRHFQVGNYWSAIRECLKETQDRAPTFADGCRIVRALYAARGLGPIWSDRPRHQENPAAALLRATHLEHFEAWLRPAAGSVPSDFEAAFPMVFNDDRPATVRILRVTDSPVRSAWPAPSPFRELIDQVKALAEYNWRLDLSGAHWHLFPDLPANGLLDEPGSAAAAALVAFWAFGHGRRPTRPMIYTGALAAGIDVGRQEIRLERPGDLQAKEAAVAAEYPHLPLWVPPDSARADPTTLTSLLYAAFGEGFLRQENPSPLARASTASIRELALRIRAFLSAAPGISLTELDRALRAQEGGPGLLLGVELHREVARFAVFEDRERDTFRARKDQVLKTGTHLNGARECLARLNSPESRSRRGLFLWTLDRKDEARSWLEQQLGTGEHRDLRGAWATLEQIHTHESDQGNALGTADLVRQLSPEIPDCALIRIAWAAREAGYGFQGLAQRLFDCESPVERLFWVQAVAEGWLHLLTGLAFDLGLVTPESDLDWVARLERRPNLGDLCEAASTWTSKMAREKSMALGLGSDLPVGGLTSQRIKIVAEKLNETIHHADAWPELAESGPNPAVDLAMGKLLPVVMEGVESWRDFARARPIELQPRSNEEAEEEPSSQLVMRREGSALVLGGHFRLLAPRSAAEEPELAFYRGVLGEQRRYWSFTSLRREPPRRAESGEGAPKLGGLPTPLARLARALRSSDARPPMVQLALLDAAVASALRLVWFSIFCAHGDWAEPEPKKTLDGRKRSIRWLQRVNKRNLFDSIRATEDLALPEIPAALRDSLLAPAARSALENAIDDLERMEHAPPPFPDHEQGAFYYRETVWSVQRVLAALPFGVEQIRVRGRDLQGEAYDFITPGPPARRAELVGLAPGELVLDWGSARQSLWPLALCGERVGDDTGPHILLFQERTSSKKGLFDVTLKYLERPLQPKFDRALREIRWKPSPAAPSGIEVEFAERKTE